MIELILCADVSGAFLPDEAALSGGAARYGKGVGVLSRRLARTLTPKVGLYFAALLLMAAVTFFWRWDVALVELILVAVLAIWTIFSVRRQRLDAGKYLEGLLGSVDKAARDGALNCPMPLVMFRPDTGEVVWSNERFLRIAGGPDTVFDTDLAQLVPGFDSRWLLEGKNVCPGEIDLEGRRYQVFGAVTRTEDKDGDYPIATTYWLDVTELADERDVYHATKPVAAILLLDNYEEVIKTQAENVRSYMLNEISQRIAAWTDDVGGMLCQLDRDRYLFLFEEQYLSGYKARKFSLLDSIREVENSSGIPATMSIGVGVDGDSLGELYRFANLSVEMALSRGGDQAVIKTRTDFEFYGGRGKETERRTKVKSRVMASAMAELMADASCVLVMGHKAPDMDAVGAAVGVCAIARMKGVPHYILRPDVPSPADELYRRVGEMAQYQHVLVDHEEALALLEPQALLVVVDTNRPEQVMDEELLHACYRVAVIDHHRRAATYIDGAALNFHEPYASSACELVSELIGNLMEPADLLPGEAEAMMAGLMLDTKNFTMRTGARTFEAAAMLRRAGGDTARVRKMFQTDLNDAVEKYSIIQTARMYRPGVAIAASDRTVGRVTAAQAADELLNIAGVGCSFVIYPDGDRVVVSARSMDDTNVQVIVEALGGGGNAGAAGAQIPGRTVEEVRNELTAVLDSYFDKGETGSEQG